MRTSNGSLVEVIELSRLRCLAGCMHAEFTGRSFLQIEKDTGHSMLLRYKRGSRLWPCSSDKVLICTLVYITDCGLVVSMVMCEPAHFDPYVYLTLI